jgi:hypothetical protein
MLNKNNLPNEVVEAALVAHNAWNAFIKKREQSANSAWFLCRTMSAVTGCRQEEVSARLSRYDINQIIEEAGIIQNTFHSKTADEIQKILVG